MKAYRGTKGAALLILTPALDGDEWSARERTLPPLPDHEYEGVWGPEPVWNFG